MCAEQHFKSSIINYDIDKEPLKVARICSQNNISTLNTICFVSVAGHTDTADNEIFSTVRRYLGFNMSDISMMILTHCNMYNEDTLRKFEKERKKQDGGHIRILQTWIVFSWNIRIE